MADIDTKKIISISDGANAMPINWGINVSDIRYNNAIIMATAIARRIDKQNLWNGLINVKEKVPSFSIKKPTYKFTAKGITDELIFDVQKGIQKSFSEGVKTISINRPNWTTEILGHIKESFPIPTAEKLPIGTVPLLSGNLSKNTLYVELRNPINIGAGTLIENITAFSVIVTVNVTTYYPNITSIDLTGQNTIKLVLDEDIMEQSTQVITVLYDASKGTLEDSFNGGMVASFQTSFNYEKKESDT